MLVIDACRRATPPRTPKSRAASTERRRTADIVAKLASCQARRPACRRTVRKPGCKPLECGAAKRRRPAAAVLHLIQHGCCPVFRKTLRCLMLRALIQAYPPAEAGALCAQPPPPGLLFSCFPVLLLPSHCTACYVACHAAVRTKCLKMERSGMMARSRADHGLGGRERGTAGCPGSFTEHFESACNSISEQCGLQGGTIVCKQLEGRSSRRNGL